MFGKGGMGGGYGGLGGLGGLRRRCRLGGLPRAAAAAAGAARRRGGCRPASRISEEEVSSRQRVEREGRIQCQFRSVCRAAASKKRPYYRIVVANSRAPRDGNYLEQIGTYNPLLAKDDEKPREPGRGPSAPAWLRRRRAADRPRRPLARQRRHQGARRDQQPQEGRAGQEGQGARRRAGEEDRRSRRGPPRGRGSRQGARRGRQRGDPGQRRRRRTRRHRGRGAQEPAEG